MSRKPTDKQLLSRRAILKSLGVAPLLLRSSPFFGAGFFDIGRASGGIFEAAGGAPREMGFSDPRLVPHYPSKSPLEDVLRLVPPGSDEYVTERYAFEIAGILGRWSEGLRASGPALFSRHADISFLHDDVDGSTLSAAAKRTVRSRAGIEVVEYTFNDAGVQGQVKFAAALQAWLEPFDRLDTAEFQITELSEIASSPVLVQATIRYELAGTLKDGRREGRIGSWRTEWTSTGPAAPAQKDTGWQARRWRATKETRSTAAGPMFIDVTQAALGGTRSYEQQLLRGSDYWRTVLDGACGIDVYGNNGVAAGDYDNDGFDDLYVCQPAGLPNRLYKNRGDGSFEDVTERAGVGVLDGTACALFADFRNKGVQDLLVVCGSGPLLFLNQGDGGFVLKPHAFTFARPPQGTFTHAALSDYDGDGRLDIYFCLYSYYLGLDQYHYPVPYFDARNGPPNFLMHNEGDGNFVDKTEAAGLNAENNRYSFACAWGRSIAESAGEPGRKSYHDLYVANDFGRNNLYRNHGDGTFTAISSSAHVEDVGAGMSACWADVDCDGRQDIYVSNMWSAAGKRVSAQKNFHEQSTSSVRELYQRHAGGNALYRNQGEGTFENASEKAGVAMGRWAWSSDFWDFDHDGFPDLYVANGYITAPQADVIQAAKNDLGSFFWRQVVGRSQDDASANLAYEHGWQALNELIRADSSWNGRERNVMFANNGDGTFSDVSAITGLDFMEDSRSFAVADIDHDGRLEVVLKNRDAPQIRILHNAMQELGPSVVFRLRGTESNRDAIGASISFESDKLRQIKYVQAGTGFLSQHSKEVFFGFGANDGPFRATVRWPSGLAQHFEAIPSNHRIELVEGSPSFVATPLATTPAAFVHGDHRARIEEIPSRISTWLIDPLKAPGFSQPDSSGKLRTLADFRNSFVLLHFWSTKFEAYAQQLHTLQLHRAAFAAVPLLVLAINVDPEETVSQARSFVSSSTISYPMIFASNELSGTYNLIYRYLFDRRRDMAIPTSFLLDKNGMIVKLYQGALDAMEVLEDVRNVPETNEARMQNALPFRGTLHRDGFQRNDFTYGVAMFQHGYLEQAEASFEEVVRAKPDNAEGYYNLGTLSLRKNDFEKARQYLQRSLELRSDYPEAWNNLGMMAAQQGKADEAIEDFTMSLKLRPTYATALLNLGNVYRRKQEFGKAEECLIQAWHLQPDDAEVNYSLGILYAQQNDLQRASNYLQKAIDLRPGYPEAINNLGVLFVHEKDYASAEKQFNQCIEAAPGFDQSYINLAQLYMLQNDNMKAEALLQRLLQQQPDNQKALRALESLKAIQ